MLSLTHSHHFECFQTQYRISMSIGNYSQAFIEFPNLNFFHRCCCKMLTFYSTDAVYLLVVSIHYDVMLAILILSLIHFLRLFTSNAWKEWSLGWLRFASLITAIASILGKHLLRFDFIDNDISIESTRYQFAIKFKKSCDSACVVS